MPDERRILTISLCDDAGNLIPTVTIKYKVPEAKRIALMLKAAAENVMKEYHQTLRATKGEAKHEFNKSSREGV